MKSIVIVSTADWDNPFWTNKQHVALTLNRLGCKVLYIESVGLRKATFTRTDVVRIGNRLKKILKSSSKEVKPNLWVWSPFVIPFNSIWFVRLLNKFIYSRKLSLLIKKKLGTDPTILWTYNPITTSLLDISKFKKSIYHCVDDISTQPGMPKEVIQSSERELLTNADFVFVTSMNLYDKHKRLNERTYYLPNVVDFQHFNSAQHHETQLPTDLESFRNPIVGFVGAISPYKLNLTLIKEVASLCPNYDFVFIGKIGEGEPNANVEDISELVNVHLIGPRSYQMLPNYLKRFDVTIIPANLNEYTKSMFPMKFFEYLAAGKPVVATNLDALQDYSSMCWLCADVGEFVKSINEAIKFPAKFKEQGVKEASQNTYLSRTVKMLELINEETS